MNLLIFTVPRLEDLLRHITSLKMRLELINALRPYVAILERDAFHTWCDRQSAYALSSFNKMSLFSYLSCSQWSILPVREVNRLMIIKPPQLMVPR